MGADRTPKGDRRARRPRGRGRGGLGVFLLASVVPAGAAGYLLLMPADDRARLLEKIPPGAGGRALAAGAAFAAMAVLAWGALPAFHHASSGLRDVGARWRQKGLATRVLLLPLSFLLDLAWLLVQTLFAVDVFLILAAGLVGLLLAIRIVDPSFLPGILPSLGRA